MKPSASDGMSARSTPVSKQTKWRGIATILFVALGVLAMASAAAVANTNAVKRDKPIPVKRVVGRAVTGVAQTVHAAEHAVQPVIARVEEVPHVILGNPPSVPPLPVDPCPKPRKRQAEKILVRILAPIDGCRERAGP